MNSYSDIVTHQIQIMFIQDLFHSHNFYISDLFYNFFNFFQVQELTRNLLQTLPHPICYGATKHFTQLMYGLFFSLFILKLTLQIMKLIIEFLFMISHCKQMNDVSVQRVREADYMKDFLCVFVLGESLVHYLKSNSRVYRIFKDLKMR